MAGNSAVQVRILFDIGSERSYIAASVAKSLNLQGPQETLAIETLGGQKPLLRVVENVTFCLKGLAKKGEPQVEVTASTLPSIGAICTAVPFNPSKTWGHLENVKFADVYPRKEASCDILIGLDNYWELVVGNLCRGKPREPVAMETTLGWVLTGALSGVVTTAAVAHAKVTNEDLGIMLGRFWSTESLGIGMGESKTLSIPDERVLSRFHQYLEYDGKRYTTQIIYKEIIPDPLLDNYAVALCRLKSVERSLGRDQRKAAAYTKAINEYVELGFAEEVTSRQCDGWVNYLPHHAVFKEQRQTTKVRIVFDGSAEGSNGVSLNDTVEVGPPLMPELLHVIIAFRTHRTALMGDVSKMFLRIKLDSNSRNVLRYLWRNMDLNVPPKIYRMNCVTFGINQSSFSAIGAVQAHVRPYVDCTRAAAEVLQHMYVDDLITGDESDEEAIKLREDTQVLMEEGGFPMGKWISNSKRVNESIPEELRGTAGLQQLTKEEDPSLSPAYITSKALGVQWNTYDDTLVFTYPDLTAEPVDTRRQVCSLLPKIYDPMGLISPYVITAKMLLQEVCQLQTDWDEKLPQDMINRWKTWQADIPNLDGFKMPRWFGGSRHDSFELHCFGDASQLSYAACVYIRYEAGYDTKSSLVMSKAKVAPINGLNLPRLELLGTLLAAQLGNYVAKALGVGKEVIFCWTDSQVVRAWLQKPATTWRVWDDGVVA